MQNKILVVDGDTRSLRLLEVSLVQNGYRVVTATSGADALSQLEIELPDLVLADTDIGAVDGFALYEKLQDRPEWAHLPFIFILDGENPLDKLRAVQLGASDFLTKPVFLKEALSRVELLLEKQAQRGEGGVGAALGSGRARFTGSLSGTALLDLLQTMELGAKSGIAYCVSGRGQRAVIYFADGAVVDAELGRLRGEEALYRVLTFQGGEYRVELLTVVRPRRIELGTAGLLMEAMRHLEEWNRLCATLPPLTTPLLPATLAGNAGALRPEMLPSELRDMLQRFDGQLSVLEVLDQLDEEEADPPHDALRRLAAVAKLYAARLLVPTGRPISGEPRAPVPTPIAVPRLTPPPGRLTPPPMPRFTPPPFTPARAAATLASLARPTPVAVPRVVVHAPLAVPAHQPDEVVTGPMVQPPAPQMFSSDVPTGPIAMPLPAGPQTTQHRPTDPVEWSQSTSPLGAEDAGTTDEYPTPLPRHYPANARHTPAELVPVLPAARLTPPPLRPARLTSPPLAQGRLTPPPISQGRLTPPPIAQARLTPPPLAQGRLTPPPIAHGRLTPPPIAHGRLTPPPLPGRPVRNTPSMLHTAARLTPPPIPVRPARNTPPMVHATPGLAPLPVSDSMVVPLAAEFSRRTPPMVHAVTGTTPLPISDSMVIPLSSRSEQSLPALRLAPRPTPAPVAEASISSESALEGESANDSSASSPGRNLARLAQRLAATRQPLPFTPPLPNFSAAEASGQSEPGFVSATMWSSTGSGSQAVAPAASVSWVGSAPELEPISIPEFEVAAVEHSAPSWVPDSGRSAAPQRELKPEKTLSVHSRPQRIAVDNSQAAVHISAPVRLPAEIASTTLAPITFDAARPGTAAPPRRLGRTVAWLGAGVALFGLGVGLFWMRQDLDRGTAESPRENAPSIGASPSAPATGSETTLAAEPQRPAPAPTPTATAGTEEPRAPSRNPAEPSAQPVASAEPSATPATATTPSAVTATAEPPSTKPTMTAPPSAVSAPAEPPSAKPVAAAPSEAAAEPPSVKPRTVVAQAPVSPAIGTTSAAPANSTEAAAPAAEGDFAALIAKARAFERRGALSPARRAIKDAQRLNPDSAEVFALLAQLALDEGNADKAAALAKRAILVDPGIADAFLVLGTVEQARTHAAKARDYFKKYLTLAPNGDRAHDVRAVLHMSH